MAFVEDLTVFLDDFGVTVTAGAVSGLGIFDMPGEYVAGDMVISTAYMLRCQSSKFGSLKFGASLTVSGTGYVVRENKLLDDGVFCLITLSKSDGSGIVSTVITTLDSLKLITQDGSYLVIL